MRLQTLGTYTPGTVSTTTYGTGFTGAGPFTMTTPAGIADGLGHFVSLTSSANLSGITFTLTGLDQDGIAQTEALAGPNNTTTTSVKYFTTLTTVAASSTLGANTLDVGFLAGAISKTLPLNGQAQAFSVGLMVDVSGTINYTVQHTIQDIWGTTQASALTWIDNVAPLVSATTDATSNYAVPVMATRLKITSYTASATIKFTVLQGRD